MGRWLLVIAVGGDGIRFRLTDFATVALFLATLLLPIYFVLKRETGFVAGVFSFWICSTLCLGILAVTEGEEVPTSVCYLGGGWFFGAVYCMPFSAIKSFLRARRNPGGDMCPKCGGDLRNTPGWCQECGPVPRKEPPSSS